MTILSCRGTSFLYTQSELRLTKCYDDLYQQQNLKEKQCNTNHKPPNLWDKQIPASVFGFIFKKPQYLKERRVYSEYRGHDFLFQMIKFFFLLTHF